MKGPPVGGIFATKSIVAEPILSTVLAYITTSIKEDPTLLWKIS
jgi:hypothetical protein